MVPAPSCKVSRVSQYSGSRRRLPALRLRGSHPLWPVFPGPFRCARRPLPRSEPRGAPRPGLGSSRFARRYSGNHFCFLLLRLLRCFSSPGSPPRAMDSPADMRVFPAWVSPFRNLRIFAHVPLPAAFRSLSRLSSAPSAKASAPRPFQLDPGRRPLAWGPAASLSFLLWFSLSFPFRSGGPPAFPGLGCLCLGIRFSRYGFAGSPAVGLSGLEPPTSRLSGVRSNRLSYKPFSYPAAACFPGRRPVSSAVRVLTFVFGTGTGVSPGRVTTGYSFFSRRLDG